MDNPSRQAVVLSEAEAKEREETRVFRRRDLLQIQGMQISHARYLVVAPRDHVIMIGRGGRRG